MECTLLEQGQNRMDRERIWKRYGMGMEWIWNIQNGQRVGTRTQVVRQQNAVSQAFPSC